MIRIAVVDDELFFADRIREIADKFFKDKNIDYEIKVYTHPVELKWDVEDGDYFDIYLIDIEMPGMDGLALAQCIRMTYAEPYIIFITAHMKYSIKGYEYNVWRYIIKDRADEQLPLAFEGLIKQLKKRQERFYIIESPSKTVKVSYDDIYYLHIKGKYTYFYARTGIYRDRCTLKQAVETLDSTVFRFVNKSYVVNLKHILEIDGTSLVMRDGELIDLSVPQRSAVKSALSDLWRGNLK